ncbi:MAG: hypothetical protein NTW86_32850, partial [Candidatus Sumerlaeota bacterium]|nr:hypothetical protein [Candidatus Sumerlaeota bacterium]
MNSLRVQPILLAALVALGAALTPYAGAQPPGFGGLFGGRDSGRGGGEGGSSSGRGRSDTSQARTAASRVVAYADQRTNSVVVRAPREVLDMIGKIVNDLDLNPAVNMTIYIFPLANADASNLATILNDLFSQLSGTTGTSNRRYSTSATSSFFSRPSTSSGRSSGSSGFGGGGSGFGGGSSGFGGGGGGSSFGRSAGGDEEWNPPPIPKDATTSRHSKASEAAGGDSAVNMGIEGSIYVVADTYTNSLLVLTDPANYERVQSIILSLDRSLPQALIKVLIAEVTHTEDWDLGAEFRGYHDKGETTQDVAGTNFNLSKETTGLVVQILDKNLEMTLRAIQEAGNLEVLSRPSILAVNNQQANITVGQMMVPFDRPFLTSDFQLPLAERPLASTILYPDRQV